MTTPPPPSTGSAIKAAAPLSAPSSAAAAPYGTFTVSCPTTLTATTYQLQAVGSGGTAGFNFFIDQLGNQSSTVAPPAPSGWTSCTIAWETKAGQCP